MSELLFNSGIILAFLIFSVNIGNFLKSKWTATLKQSEKATFIIKYFFIFSIVFLIGYIFNKYWSLLFYTQNYFYEAFGIKQLILGIVLFFTGFQIHTKNKTLFNVFMTRLLSLSVFIFIEVYFIHLVKKSFHLSLTGSVFTVLAIFLEILALVFIFSLFKSKKNKETNINEKYSQPGLPVLLLSFYILGSLMIIPVFNEFEKIYFSLAESPEIKITSNHIFLLLIYLAVLLFGVFYKWNRLFNGKRSK